jgi:pimeloyl-ACP methyl ester carboxylesterase
MVAQALVIKHPDLVRKLILTGTGPAGGKDIDRVAGTTYYDILRATLTRSDPKEFLFFNRNATRQARRSRVRQPAQGAHRRARRPDLGEGVPNAAQGDQEVGSLGPQ